MKNLLTILTLKRSFTMLFISLIILSFRAQAQCPETELISGLREPMGIVLTNQGNLLVSENGTAALHSGRISIVDPNSGSRRTLLEGLPSALSDVNEPSGPHGIVIRGRTLYVSIGVGDVGVAGPIPGTTLPNPNVVSSPIFSSVLAINFSAAVEKNTSGFNLTTAHQQALANGETVTLSNGGGDRISIQMIVNFPDYIPFPLQFFANNIQLSNPFQMAVSANQLYVTDGGRNLVWKVNLNSGSYSQLAAFPNIPNPVFPTFGGPFLEPVPTGIDYDGDQIFVTLFRGFPFPPGVSSVLQIDPQTGSYTNFINGLRSAIGVMTLKEHASTEYLVLQHNSGGTILPPFTGPGLLLHFESPSDPPALIADCIARPTDMILDKKSGKLFVSERGGSVVALDLSSVLAKHNQSSGRVPEEFIIKQNYPNPFNPSTTINYSIPSPGFVTLKVFDVLGKEAAVLVNEEKAAGSYEVNFDASQLSTGIYFYTITSGSFAETKKMILIK